MQALNTVRDIIGQKIGGLLKSPQKNSVNYSFFISLFLFFLIFLSHLKLPPVKEAESDFFARISWFLAATAKKAATPKKTPPINV